MKTNTLLYATAAILAMCRTPGLLAQYDDGPPRTSEKIPAYPAIERDGVLIQFEGWDASSTARLNLNGIDVDRSLTIRLSVFDPSGAAIFKVVGPRRVDALIDDNGVDYSKSTRLVSTSRSDALNALSQSVFLFSPRSRAGVRSYDRMSLACYVDPCEIVPRSFKELSGTISIARPGKTTEIVVPVQDRDVDWRDVGDGIAVRTMRVKEVAEGIQVTLRMRRPQPDNDPLVGPLLVNIELRDRESGKIVAVASRAGEDLSMYPTKTDQGVLLMTTVYPNPAASGLQPDKVVPELVLTFAESATITTIPFTFKDIPLSKHEPADVNHQDADAAKKPK